MTQVQRLERPLVCRGMAFRVTAYISVAFYYSLKIWWGTFLLILNISKRALLDDCRYLGEKEGIEEKENRGRKEERKLISIVSLFYIW